VIAVALPTPRTVSVTLRCAALVALLACGSPAQAQAQVAPAGSEIVGAVTEVISGDTLIVMDGARRVEVRLADIDAPQGSEHFAPGARGLLSGMVQGHEVRVRVTGSAGPDRVFGRVVMKELDVNLEMVKRGATFVCWDFPVDTYFLPWENEAKRHRRGLWSSTWDITARADCLRRPPGEWPAKLGGQAVRTASA
jgi:endonuclease YncB( thermonuclease family)